MFSDLTSQPLLIAALVAGIALVAFWLVTRRDRREMAQQDAETRQLRAQLAERLMTEAVENKNKTDAFISIYGELVQKLRHIEQAASYQETGDFIHRHVPLTRAVYDAHRGEWHVLGQALEQELHYLYERISPDSVYDELTRDTPRGQALQAVEAIIEEAQTLSGHLDSVIRSLGIIQRDTARQG